MVLNTVRTVHALMEGGEYVALKKESGTDHKADVIFYREIDKEKNQEYLVVRSRRQLSLFQRIKLFFRTSDFSLETVNRLAVKALGSTKTIKKVTKGRPENKYHLFEGVNFLKEKIEHGQTPKWYYKIRSSPSSRIDIKDILKKIHKIKPSTTSLVGKKTVPTSVQVPAKVAPPAPKDVFTGRGIVNPGSFCYCNSALKLIFFSEALQKELSNPLGNSAAALQQVMKALDDRSSKKFLSYNTGELKEFVQQFRKEILKGHKDLELLLKDPSVQMDQQELLLPLFKAILGEERTDHLLSLREVVQRDRGKDILAAKEQGQTLSELDQAKLLIQQAYIPAFDSENKPVENAAMLFFRPGEHLVQHIEEYFGSAAEDNVDIESIIKQPENAALFTEENKKLLRDQAKKHPELTSINIFRRYTLVGDAPSFLPVYIPRFSSTWSGTGVAKTRKNSNYVVAPFDLTVPVQGKDSAHYRLTGIACHAGSALQGGHYYNYFPWPDSPLDETGRPIYWMQHSDPIISAEPVKWDEIAEDVAANVTTYLYDKLP